MVKAVEERASRAEGRVDGWGVGRPDGRRPPRLKAVTALPWMPRDSALLRPDELPLELAAVPSMSQTPHSPSERRTMMALPPRIH